MDGMCSMYIGKIRNVCRGLTLGEPKVMISHGGSIRQMGGDIEMYALRMWAGFS
jgi:hypothetical protein